MPKHPDECHTVADFWRSLADEVLPDRSASELQRFRQLFYCGAQAGMKLATTALAESSGALDYMARIDALDTEMVGAMDALFAE